MYFRKITIGLIIILSFFLIELFTLSDYGINWDEPAHYMRGQAYLYYLLTGKENYKELLRVKSHYEKSSFYEIPKDVEYEDTSQFRRSIYQYDREDKVRYTYHYYAQFDGGHPPINGILASLSNHIFYQKLGWLDDIQSYHLFIIVTSTVLVCSIFFFVTQYFGLFSGVIASLSLILYPLFFSESHFNIKDPVETTFFTLTLFTFFKGITSNSWKWILASAAFTGLALGTKLNIIFISLILGPWLLLYKWNKIKKMKWPFTKGVSISLFLLPIISFLIFYLSWPFLWQDFKNVLSILSYYQDIGSRLYQPTDYILFRAINTYAWKWVLFITPLSTLLLFILGIIYTINSGFKEKTKLSLLILFWFLVPLLRVSTPTAGIYGGVRQVMEYIPAMAILTGIGAIQGIRYLFKIIKLKPESLKKIKWILLIIFVPITIKIVSIHPNENVYFNPLIGGLSGARERNFADWGVTLGSPYKQGVDWLNNNTEKDANLTLVRGYTQNVPRISLRKDINFSDHYFSGKEKKGEYLMEVTDYNWLLTIPTDKRLYIESLDPVHEVKVDGVPILTIWKNDKIHSKN